MTTQRVAAGIYRFRVVKKGYGLIEEAAAAAFGASLHFQLHTSEETPAGMVWVPGLPKRARATLTYPVLTDADIPAFWIDRYEVTNRQFKELVDRGWWLLAYY